MWERRWETEDGRQETGDGRKETGYRRRKTVEGKRETEDGRQEKVEGRRERVNDVQLYMVAMRAGDGVKVSLRLHLTVDKTKEILNDIFVVHFNTEYGTIKNQILKKINFI